eukprot:TRINITY_DN10323_c0_g1_i1.p1 TRINITY_DN10323_c0_g1~~TRINITY_DN10323_c0_g1_i1.p1  ORF type:complete len:242 (-),score=44.49 TRINITY_DN10323_c0_g1_i1:62-787(-)
MKRSTLVVLFVIFAVSNAANYQWPKQWHANLTNFWAKHDPMPPYHSPDGLPSAPFTAGRLHSYYDYTQVRFVEHYEDNCLAIFNVVPNWSCKFMNINKTVYLVTGDTRPAKLDPCCIFLDSFVPPPPNFLDFSGAKFNETLSIDGNQVDYYHLELPNPGFTLNFGYGFYQRSKHPALFWFDALEGWVAQKYDEFAAEAPDNSHFEVPDYCDAAVQCPQWLWPGGDPQNVLHPFFSSGFKTN